MGEDDTLARVAYAAYGNSTGHLNYQGNPMPTWDELPERIRTAWIAAARAVCDEQLRLAREVIANYIAEAGAGDLYVPAVTASRDDGDGRVHVEVD